MNTDKSEDVDLERGDFLERILIKVTKGFGKN
jgi:hypothetical protein